MRGGGVRRFTASVLEAENCGAKKSGATDGWFYMEQLPGFFVPALRRAFYSGGNCGVKKGGVNDWGKLRSGVERSEAERSNFDLFDFPLVASFALCVIVI
jgi:hypothetical protein